jgi:hypothetical protein
MKTAIFVMSDPQGGDESLGRLFNALAVAAEGKAAGDDVAIVFAGSGTRWPEQLGRLDHPAHELYQSLREQVRGASCGCADIFGAAEGLAASGTPLLKDFALDGTSGVVSVRSYIADGFQPFVF